MNEYNFDAELRQLLDSEERKQRQSSDNEAYGTLSLKDERHEILEAFYDHVTTAYSSDDKEMNIEQALNPTPEEDLEDFADNINAVLQIDIEQNESLFPDEIEVTGVFPFFAEPDTDEYEAHDQILDDGEKILGKVSGYRVAPMLSHSKFVAFERGDDASLDHEDPRSLEDGIGVWLILEQVQVIDGSGAKQANYETVIVPFSFPGVNVGKVIRRYSEKSTENLPPAEPLNLKEHLTGDIFLEIRNDIENDLNYNKHEPAELSLITGEYQAQLQIFMDIVDQDDEVIISAGVSRTMDGEERLIDEKSAFYIAPTIIKSGPYWRVAHGFSVADYNGEGVAKIVHILPESLEAIRFKEK